MFYDLNVPYTRNHTELQRTLTFLAELGYNTIALSHTITGKIPGDLTSPIPSSLPFPTPRGLDILTRLTLHLDSPSQNHRLPLLAAHYDIIAVRPTDEKSLQSACLSLQPSSLDIISLDLSVRYPFYFKSKQLCLAVEQGIRFEICYSAGILEQGEARRNFISNAGQLCKATKGRGVVVSSEAARALGIRGPWDVVNLCEGWGLGRERGMEAVGREARGVVVGAEMRKKNWRGVIDVVSGGAKPSAEEIERKKSQAQEGKKGKGKRNAEDDLVKEEAKKVEQPLSKRQMRKKAHEARMAAKEAAKDIVDTGKEADTTPKNPTADVSVVNGKDQG